MRALLAAALPFAVAGFALAETNIPLSDCPAEAPRWMAELQSSDFSSRTAATGKLIAAGPCIVLRVAELAESGDPEIAWRAREIVEVIALADEASFQLVSDRLVSAGHDKLAAQLAKVRAEQEMLKNSPWLRGLTPMVFGLRYGC